MRRIDIAIILVVFTSLGLLLPGCASFFGQGDIDAPLPPRPFNAMSGSQFGNSILGLSGSAREAAIEREISRGNIPNFLRRLKPVALSGWSRGRKITGLIWVMPDYLSIGSDSDYLRIPMMPMTAQRLASKFGFVLPTRKLVNDIYRQASVHLPPRPRPPGPQMVSTRYYIEHNKTVEAQISSYQRGRLIGGQKKDIVLTNRLISQPGRVAIYGWHTSNGHAIQPLSLWHGKTYVDYSHGVRFISNDMMVDGKKMKLRDVLRSPQLSSLVSDEGALQRPQLPIALNQSISTDNLPSSFALHH